MQFNSANKKSVGEDLAIDFILYSCMEEEKKQRKLTQEGASFISWPNIKGLDHDELVDSLQEEYEEDLLEDMISWYAANFEELATAGPWDYGNISDVIPALVSLNNDIVRIVKAKSENGKFPDLSSEGASTSKQWVRIKKLVDQYFSRKAHIIRQYLEWSHTPESERAPLQPKALKAPQQVDPNGNTRRQHGNMGGGGGQHGFKKNSQDNYRENGRHRNKDRNSNNGGNHNRQRHNHNQENVGNGAGRRPGDPEREAQAIRECRDALTILRSDATQQAITLQPQNSFYRRVQHNHISENGFFSISVGEGKERSVQVHRTLPEGKVFSEDGAEA